ncbi:MAG TPA: M14 family zinc carboxypeptidase, partial [Flavobacterium sp.]|nr:M14 family zinc carboxypeptidase [Flavobacterium sp.]
KNRPKKESVPLFITVIPTVLIMGLYFVLNGVPAQIDRNNAPNIEQVDRQEDPEFEKKIFGHSVKNRPIEGYEIGNGSETLLLFSAIHGNEKGTADLLSKLVEELKTNPNFVADTKKLVIIPIANPDGYYDRDDKLNGNEVNLNLNFKTTGWAKYGKSGTFAGNEPFTEPESRIIKEIVEQYKPSMMISFHSQGALVSPERDSKSMELGKWYAEKSGYVYFDEWDDSGTATKWFVETTGNPAITVELTNHTDSDWQLNEKALLELIAK